MNAASDESDLRPLVAHIVFRFDYGGLENGVANLLNGLQGERLRHAVIAMTEATSFAERLPADVRVYEIGKQPGKDPRAYIRLFRLLRQLAPTVVHTRNFGTIDCAFIAFLARVPVRIHGEHGWDVFDPDGTNRKYRLIRQAMSPFIDRFVTVSQELGEWLENVVGIPHKKITRICNGVDTARFRPAANATEKSACPGAGEPGRLVIGSVTRFSKIKDPLNLVEAFRQLVATQSGRGFGQGHGLGQAGGGVGEAGDKEHDQH
jgi:sugar transferase (PEP-CTERM/EpsH1 system associated)